MRPILPIAVFVCIGVLAGCTNFPGQEKTIFDLSPARTSTKITNIDTLITAAGNLQEIYAIRAEINMNAKQFFDIPVIGAAITAATALAFGGHPDIALAAGAVGGGSAAYSGYYSPLARGKIYNAGAIAMTCIEQLAIKYKSNHPHLLQHGATAPSNSLIPLSTITNSNNEILANKSLAIAMSMIVSEDEAVSKLSNAIDQVSERIFTRITDETTTSDLSTIIEKIKQDIKISEQNEENLVDSLNTERSEVPFTHKIAIMNTPEVQTRLNLDTDISTCVTKAG